MPGTNDADNSLNPVFPLSRVKKIMKQDPDVGTVNTDAIVAVAFSTEYFLQFLLETALTFAQQDKRKTIAYKDLVNAIKHTEQLEFLTDAIPPPVAPVKAVERAKKQSAIPADSYQALTSSKQADE